MPQLDKELFIDYIFYILLIMIHIYTGFQINKNLYRLNARRYLIDNFRTALGFVFKEKALIIKAFSQSIKS